MNRALAYGLMGAAQGVLGGLYNEWQQSQEDIHTQKLLQAKAKEQAGVERLAHYYRSQENVQKVELSFQKESRLADQKAKNDKALAAQKQAAEKKLHAADNAADIAVANINASSKNQPRPAPARGEQIWRDASGSNVVVKPGEVPPPQGKLIWSANGHDNNPPVLGLMGSGLLGGGLNETAPGAPAPAPVPAPNPAPTFHGQPTGQAFHGFGTRGTSRDNPVDAADIKGAPQPGTWLRLADGSVKRYMGSK